MSFACSLHLLGATYATIKKGRGEVLLFKDRKVAEALNTRRSVVVESNEKGPTASSEPSSNFRTVALCWDKVTFDVKAGKAYKRILHEVDGWIEHGTLTALMVCLAVDQQFPRLYIDDE